MEKEAAAFAAQSRAPTCDGEVLAGEAGGDDSALGYEPRSSQVVTGHFTDVGEQGRAGETIGEHAAGGVVDLHGGHDGDAGALQG